MKQMISIVSITFFCLLSFSGYPFAEEVPNTEQGITDWLKEKFGDVRRSPDQEPIADYIKGKVVDQNGNPIPDVSVTNKCIIYPTHAKLSA